MNKASALDSMHHYYLPPIRFGPPSIGSKIRARGTHAYVPTWLLLALTVTVWITPAGAFDEPGTLSHSLVSHHHDNHTPIGPTFALFFLIGQYVVAFSGFLVGPLMGITSVLWLMMRNDAAISPKASWM